MSVVRQDDALLEACVVEAEEALAAGDIVFEPAAEALVAEFVPGTDAVAGLKFVSLRDQVGPWDANQGAAKKTLPPTAHYRGPTGSVSKGRSPVAELVGSANYHMRMDWGDGARANGLQYHSAVWGDTVYLCRNPLAILWHAANPAYNAGSHGCQFPIGGTEISTTQTRQTAKAWFDEINRTWGTRGAKGHLEVSQLGTECPGRTHGDFVIPYRAGETFGATPSPAKPAPAPAKTLYRVFAGGEQQGAYAVRSNATDRADALIDRYGEVRIAKGPA